MRPGIVLVTAGTLVASGCQVAAAPAVAVEPSPVVKPAPVQRFHVKPRPKPRPKVARKVAAKAKRHHRVHVTTQPMTAGPFSSANVHTFADLPRVWQRIAMCESSGDLREVTGSYLGLFQVQRGWWHGLDYRTATLQQQYALALHVFARQGFGAWTCASILGID